MVDLQESVLAEMDHRGRSMVLDELLALVERHHPTDEAGISREIMEAYLAEMDARGFADADGLDAKLEDRLTDDENWAGSEAVYRMGGDRLSVLPPRWHDELGGSDDLLEYVEVIGRDMADTDAPAGRGAAGTGVTKQLLVTAATILGDFDRDTVRQRLETLREEGELVEDAHQHPQARIYVAE